MSPLVFVPDRLRIIREARGMTRARLAELLHVTAPAVTQFESGESTPSTETLKAMSAVLGVPAEYFTRPIARAPLDINDCHFRHQRSARMYEKRKVVAQGELTLQLIEEIERWVEFPKVAVRRMGRDTPANKLDALDRAAEQIRETWQLGPGPISNMVWLLENQGVIVLELAGESEKLDAFSVWSESRPAVFLASTKWSASRRRFDAAHELGHLVLHRFALPGDKMLEGQADYFAGAFLLPRQQFVQECPRWLNWSDLLALKKRWGVSLSAIVVRAAQLGILSEATVRRAFQHLNRRGWRVSEPEEPPMETPALVSQAVQALSRQKVGLSEVLGRYPLSRFDLEAFIPGVGRSEVEPVHDPEAGVLPFGRNSRGRPAAG